MVIVSHDHNNKKNKIRTQWQIKYHNRNKNRTHTVTMWRTRVVFIDTNERSFGFWNMNECVSEREAMKVYIGDFRA